MDIENSSSIRRQRSIGDIADRMALITALIDAASVVANTMAEGDSSARVGNRTLADLLTHGSQRSQQLTREIEEMV